MEAVWAFERVQGFVITAANADEVGVRVQKALVHPARAQGPGAAGRP